MRLICKLILQNLKRKRDSDCGIPFQILCSGPKPCPAAVLCSARQYAIGQWRFEPALDIDIEDAVLLDTAQHGADPAEQDIRISLDAAARFVTLHETDAILV